MSPDPLVILSIVGVATPDCGGGRKGPGIHCLACARFVREFAMNIINIFSDVQTWVETLNMTNFV